MEKVLVVTEGDIDPILKDLIESKETYELDQTTSDTIDTDKLEEYKLVILDQVQQNITEVLSKASKTPLLLCLEKENTIPKLFKADYDIIFKPYSIEELDVRFNSLTKIKTLRKEVREVAIQDELTGLQNRKYLLERLEEELSRCRRYETPISLMLMDIDYFKVVNDMYGYKEGDKVLKKLANILTAHVRKEDIVTRYGDEEFIVGLPNTNDQNAYILAERIRKAVQSFKFFEDEEPLTVTISIGVSTYPFTHMEPEVNTLIRYAEHALYNAKKQGKNKTVLFSQINYNL